MPSNPFNISVSYRDRKPRTKNEPQGNRRPVEPSVPDSSRPQQMPVSHCSVETQSLKANPNHVEPHANKVCQNKTDNRFWEANHNIAETQPDGVCRNKIAPLNLETNHDTTEIHHFTMRLSSLEIQRILVCPRSRDPQYPTASHRSVETRSLKANHYSSETQPYGVCRNKTDTRLSRANHRSTEIQCWGVCRSNLNNTTSFSEKARPGIPGRAF